MSPHAHARQHALALTLALALPLAPAHAQVAPSLPFPGPAGPAINGVQWSAADVPKLVQRSEQLPLTDDELVKLTRAGFAADKLVLLIEQRRCACDASADGLIKLKGQGVDPRVLEAIALHALKPNRAVVFELTVDFVGAGAPPREGSLNIFIEDGELTRQLELPLREAFALQGSTAMSTPLIDESDPLKARPVRRLVLSGELPLKTCGKHRALVVAQTRPVQHPSQLTPAERARAQQLDLDYPRASLQSLCRLRASFRNDPVTAGRWLPQATRFECEWN